MIYCIIISQLCLFVNHIHNIFIVFFIFVYFMNMKIANFMI